MEYTGKHSTNDLDDGYLGSGLLINRAIKKHGEENFIRRIIGHYETAAEALVAERNVVTDEYCARDDTYNIAIGGLGGALVPCTDEITAKRFATRKRNGTNRHSKETIAKMSQTHKGKIISEEHKAKTAKTLTGRKQSDETRLKRSKSLKGRIITEEHRAKISAAKMGHTVSEETKAKIAASLRNHNKSC